MSIVDTSSGGIRIMMMMEWSFDERYLPLRSALQDISGSPLSMRASPSDPNLVHTPEAFMSPSAEEQIIQQRSRSQIFRRLSLSAATKWDDYSQSDADFLQLTPAKDKLSLLPRKRLLLSPPDAGVSSRKKCKRPKKISCTQKRHSVDSPLKTELKAFTNQQLVTVLDKLVTSHPELEKEVRRCIKSPDLRPLEERLVEHRRNIYKSMPKQRWGTNRDSTGFKKAKLHLQAFKKVCLEQCEVLVNSQSWESVVRYVLLAWRLVYHLPTWEEPSHNVHRNQCFLQLNKYCLKALGKASFTKEKHSDIRKRLQVAVSLHADIEPCLKALDEASQ